MNKELAECLGLWFAEGDSKTHKEICFCNSEITLVQYFDMILRKTILDSSSNIRIYCYSKEGSNFKVPFKNSSFKFYQDKRATRPYYIWRVGSVKLTKDWRQLFEEVIKDPKYYPDFLRGFFAGEGNIKTGSHNCRTIRIAQKDRIKFIEEMYEYLGLTYTFRKEDRSYYFSGKWNWDIFAKYKLADLHLKRKKKFWDAFNSYKEIHYKNGFLKKETLKLLNKPMTTIEISQELDRSPARVYDVLTELRLENKAKYLHAGKTTYWFKSSLEIIIISNTLAKYLKGITNNNSILEMSCQFKVNERSVRKNIKSLQFKGLIEKKEGKWITKMSKKKLVII